MKKIIALLLFVLLPMFVNAQTMKFMGIPLGLSVDEFSKLLIQKGFKVSPYNGLLGNNVMLLHGMFCGYKSDVFVWYNVHSDNKLVYSVSVDISKDCVSDLNDVKLKVINAVEDKYIYTKEVDNLGELESYSYSIFSSVNHSADDFYGKIGICYDEYLLSIVYIDDKLNNKLKNHQFDDI